MSNRIFLGIILFIILIIINIPKSENFSNFSKCQHDMTKIDIHQDEIINPDLLPDKKTIYLFWTGGFDSTYRLFQIILEKKKVQPIYLNCGNVDSESKIQRQNNKEEIITMKKIRKKILEKIPESKNLFLPTQYIISLKKNPEVTHIFKKIHERGFFTRNINQYERMVRYSRGK